MKKFHKVAEIFPLMNDDELNALALDIQANGLREAIWLHPDGSIIDGRNRYRACHSVGVQPQFRIWDGKGSLVAFVVSMNLHRRHLTSSQRGIIAPSIKRELAKEIEIEKQEKGRAAALLQQNPSMPKEEIERVSAILQKPSREAASEAAQIAGVSTRYVYDAEKIERDAPDLVEKVKDAELTIPQAKREIVKRQRKESPPLPSKKYRVLYADPPWSYGNKWSGGEEKFSERWTAAETHYPSMTIAELCAMGDDIKAITEKNAVLFLWVTSPLLEECFPVIKAWGFKYKTSFVWDKVGHNFGHYNSVRHEFLLVCARGSCTPDVTELFDSVQSIEKSRVHSEKPEEFRAIIDTLYPHGKRLELFARTQADGWEAWGNEPGQYTAS